MDKPKTAKAKPQTAKMAGSVPPGIKLDGADNNTAMLAIIIAVVLVLLTIIFLWTRKSKKGRSVLFVGPCDSGKTTLMGHLLSGKMVDTVTSVTPNESPYSPGNGRDDLILKDLPGHDRVRVKFWDTHKTGIRGIICVIDAAGGNKAIREGAEVLYSVLTDSVVNSVSPNILVFANKMDMPTAKTIKVIRSNLEREITTLRMTKSAGLQSTGGSNNSSSKPLGKLDRDFEFEHLAPLKVDFAEGSCSKDEVEIGPIVSWLEKVA